MSNLQPISVAAYHMSAGFSDLNFLTVNPGMLAFFGRTENGGSVEYINNALEVKYDIIRGAVTRALYLNRSGSGFNVGDNAKVDITNKFSTVSSIFPSIMAKAAIEFNQLFDRVPNEPPTGELTIEERARWHAMRLYEKMIQKIANTMVVKAWESIRTGRNLLEDGSGVFYDWGRAASNTAAVTVPWTNVTADILTDIDTHCDIIQDNGKKDPNFMVPGVATWAGMKKNTQLTSEADNRGYLFIRAGAREGLPDLPSDMMWMVEAGLKYQAWIQTPAGREMFILTNNERVDDPDTGASTKLMPDDEVIFGWSGARCDAKFGPSTHWPNKANEAETASRLGIQVSPAEMSVESVGKIGQLDSRMFHVKTLPSDTATWFEMMSGPLFITTHTDAFGRLTGTAA